MKQYKHLFFDLDRTLWDFEANLRETLSELLVKHSLNATLDQFVSSYNHHNDTLWAEYRKGNIKKSFLRVERFRRVLHEFNTENEMLALAISDEYSELSPRKKNLLPYTIESLSYLKEKYNLYIITNGFNEIQSIKMEASGLNNFFNKVFTSEDIGFQKPHKQIFSRSLSNINARKNESMMIGDDLDVDIIGARNFGIDQVYFNPNRIPHFEKVTFEIQSLKELMQIL